MRHKLWYRKIGFRENPLSVKPGVTPVHGATKLQDIVMNIVHKGGIIFIEGEYGSGKSTLLKQLIGHFGGRKRVVYYSLNRKEQSLAVHTLLHGSLSFFGRLFGRKPKNLIVLLDEVQELYAYDQRRLLEYYYSGIIHALVVVGSNRKSCRLIPEFCEEIEHTTLRMGQLSLEEAVSLIRSRIGENVLTDDAITRIYQYNKNPRSFLKNCEHICRWAVQQGLDVVNHEHVDVVLGQTR